MRLLNNQDFNKKSISQKLVYAIFAYTFGNKNDAINHFHINIDQLLLSGFIYDHKRKTKILYSQINEKLLSYIEKVMSKINENRENSEFFVADTGVYNKR